MNSLAYPGSVRALLFGVVLMAGCVCGGGSTVPDATTSSDASPMDAGADGAVDAMVPGVCGDGVKNLDEDCDEGPDNSDTVPGACRSYCVVAGCMDGVSDPAELCLPQPII